MILPKDCHEHQNHAKEAIEIGVKGYCHSFAPAFDEMPIIDLLNPNAKDLVVKACEDYGFFKLINHGVPLETITILENEVFNFFKLPQLEKDKAKPLGYETKRIGGGGDIGWIEYFLFDVATNNHLRASSVISEKNEEGLRNAMNEYLSLSKEVSCNVLDLISEGLKIEPKNSISEMVKEEGNNTIFRINHYPPCLELINEGNIVGFGAHTDPQIITVLRSNNVRGFEICLKNGDWVSVNPDPTSFFVVVGDCLEVMSNGRFKSVKHRVSANGESSRISIIYLVGPSMDTTIKPLESLLTTEAGSLYHPFTWSDYKKNYSSLSLKLNENRLFPFKK